MVPLHTLTSCLLHVRHELHTSPWPRSEYYMWKSLERRIQSNSSHSIPTSLFSAFPFISSFTISKSDYWWHMLQPLRSHTRPEGPYATRTAVWRTSAHTHETAHIPPSAWACSVNQKSITFFDLHDTAQGKYYEGRKDKKELYFMIISPCFD